MHYEYMNGEVSSDSLDGEDEDHPHRPYIHSFRHEACGEVLQSVTGKRG